MNNNKMSDAMQRALHFIDATDGTPYETVKNNPTINSRTIGALKRRGLVTLTGEVYHLTNAGKLQRSDVKADSRLVMMAVVDYRNNRVRHYGGELPCTKDYKLAAGSDLHATMEQLRKYGMIIQEVGA